jgi:hypothetical protein
MVEETKLAEIFCSQKKRFKGKGMGIFPRRSKGEGLSKCSGSAPEPLISSGAKGGINEIEVCQKAKKMGKKEKSVSCAGSKMTLGRSCQSLSNSVMAFTTGQALLMVKTKNVGR